jgi:hypothetical protein
VYSTFAPEYLAPLARALLTASEPRSFSKGPAWLGEPGEAHTTRLPNRLGGHRALLKCDYDLVVRKLDYYIVVA